MPSGIPTNPPKKKHFVYKYVVEGFYAPAGWEEVTAEESRDEARARLKEYRENEKNTQFRLRRKKVNQ